MIIQWMRIVKVITSNGVVFNFNQKVEETFEIHFTVPFSDEPKPEDCTIELYNPADSTISGLKKGEEISIEAGYQGDVGLLAKGKILNVITSWSGVDKVTTITFLEGEDYSEKKDVNITFNKGSDAQTIINRIAGDSGIKISKMELVKNKIYDSGYTCDGSPMDHIEEVVKDCESNIYYRRGSLVIRSIKKGDDENFILSADTGMINTPQRIENDDYKGWSCECLLQHRIATASIIELKSKIANGKFRVKNGQHSFDGGNFTTSCEVIE